MARKSPRSRRKPATKPRLPGKRRPQATPGSARRTPRVARTAARASETRHAPQGARATPEPARGTRRAPRPRLGARPKSRRGRFQPPEPERVRAVLGILESSYPDARTALDFRNPLQLLVATILSAQCTDTRVNMVTPALFERYPDAPAFASAKTEELEEMVRSTGFFRNKTKAILACTAGIVERHGGEVPRTLEELTALRGVGRKTANVVLGNAFGIPGLVVDTHVARVSYRLGLTDQKDAVKIEHALMKVIPRERWTLFSHWLILHGRRICVARKPRCSICPLAVHCPRLGVTASQ